MIRSGLFTAFALAPQLRVSLICESSASERSDRLVRVELRPSTIAPLAFRLEGR